MARANNDLIENLFYNIMMNMQEDAIMFQENNQFGGSGSVINQSLYDSNPIKMVISEEEKNKLATIKYKDALNKEQNTACFITQDDFQEEDDVIQLPCNHCFSPESIMKWLTEECAECPVCRHKFDSVEKRVEITPEDVVEEEDSEMPELIPIDQPIINNVFEIDDMNQVNNFRNIFLNNLFNSLSEESNINFNYIHQYSNNINFNNEDEEYDNDDDNDVD